jgi:phage terminase Nu1 subunit (DNA packaging protein)
MSNWHPDSAIVDRLGGTGRLAELCDVSSQAVSQWKRFGIPTARRAFLKLLNPEAFALPEASAAGRKDAVEQAPQEARDAA